MPKNTNSVINITIATREYKKSYNIKNYTLFSDILFEKYAASTFDRIFAIFAYFKNAKNKPIK